ncbi:hypothetical protein BESB_004910 [Besnoitia besnoiti]|uniref:Uncharacterized protein n=1 Tax=Besnoitia besnoiti TaxID=94643 RepID=A0A2A9MQ94_BESBE|nr:hypothetical protein BESB_004910 [Besnoitia besnoiti]PFH38150.1 hypothetical protein BESB_004910 [Besnoitia besnoiti]
MASMQPMPAALSSLSRNRASSPLNLEYLSPREPPWTGDCSPVAAARRNGKEEPSSPALQLEDHESGPRKACLSSPLSRESVAPRLPPFSCMSDAFPAPVSHVPCHHPQSTRSPRRHSDEGYRKQYAESVDYRVDRYQDAIHAPISSSWSRSLSFHSVPSSPPCSAGACSSQSPSQPSCGRSVAQDPSLQVPHPSAPSEHLHAPCASPKVLRVSSNPSFADTAAAIDAAAPAGASRAAASPLPSFLVISRERHRESLSLCDSKQGSSPSSTPASAPSSASFFASSAATRRLKSVRRFTNFSASQLAVTPPPFPSFLSAHWTDAITPFARPRGKIDDQETSSDSSQRAKDSASLAPTPSPPFPRFPSTSASSEFSTRLPSPPSSRLQSFSSSPVDEAAVPAVVPVNSTASSRCAACPAEGALPPSSSSFPPRESETLSQRAGVDAKPAHDPRRVPDCKTAEAFSLFSSQLLKTSVLRESLFNLSALDLSVASRGDLDEGRRRPSGLSPSAFSSPGEDRRSSTAVASGSSVSPLQEPFCPSAGFAAASSLRVSSSWAVPPAASSSPAGVCTPEPRNALGELPPTLSSAGALRRPQKKNDSVLPVERAEAKEAKKKSVRFPPCVHPGDSGASVASRCEEGGKHEAGTRGYVHDASLVAEWEDGDLHQPQSDRAFVVRSRQGTELGACLVTDHRHGFDDANPSRATGEDLPGRRRGSVDRAETAEERMRRIHEQLEALKKRNDALEVELLAAQARRKMSLGGPGAASPSDLPRNPVAERVPAAALGPAKVCTDFAETEVFERNDASGGAEGKDRTTPQGRESKTAGRPCLSPSDTEGVLSGVRTSLSNLEAEEELFEVPLDDAEAAERPAPAQQVYQNLPEKLSVSSNSVSRSSSDPFHDMPETPDAASPEVSSEATGGCTVTRGAAAPRDANGAEEAEGERNTQKREGDASTGRATNGRRENTLEGGDEMDSEAREHNATEEQATATGIMQVCPRSSGACHFTAVEGEAEGVEGLDGFLREEAEEAEAAFEERKETLATARRSLEEERQACAKKKRTLAEELERLAAEGKELEEGKAAKEEVEKSRETCRTQKAKLDAEREMLWQANTKLEEDRRTCAEEQAALLGEKKAALKRKYDLQEELDRFKKKQQELQEATERLDADRHQFEKERAAFVNEKREFTDKREYYDARRRRMEEERERHLEEAGGLKAREEACEERKRELDKERDSLEKDKTMLEKEREAVTRERRALEEARESSAHVTRQAEEERAALAHAKGALDGEREAFAREQRELHEERESLVQAKIKVQQEREACAIQRQRLEEERTNYLRMTAEIEEERKTHAGEKRRLEEEREQYAAQARQLEADRETLTRELGELEAALKNQRGLLADKSKAWEIERETMESRLKESEEFRAKEAQAHQEREREGADAYEKLRKQNREIEAEKAVLRDELMRLQEENTVQTLARATAEQEEEKRREECERELEREKHQREQVCQRLIQQNAELAEESNELRKCLEQMTSKLADWRRRGEDAEGRAEEQEKATERLREENELLKQRLTQQEGRGVSSALTSSGESNGRREEGRRDERSSCQCDQQTVDEGIATSRDSDAESKRRVATEADASPAPSRTLIEAESGHEGEGTGKGGQIFQRQVEDEARGDAVERLQRLYAEECSTSRRLAAKSAHYRQQLQQVMRRLAVVTQALEEANDLREHRQRRQQKRMDA